MTAPDPASSHDAQASQAALAKSHSPELDEVARFPRVDASVTGSESTIETIAVHPDYRRLGIAQRLLNEICDRLQRRGATQVDAWTRDDEGTLAWYRSQGFEQKMRYLHVYASDPDEAVSAFGSQLDLMPRAGFFHAWLDHEDALRNQFSRCTPADSS